jgi:hypothetical protein
MYMTNYQFGMRVGEVTNPRNPSQIGSFDTSPGLGNVPGFGGSWSNFPYFASGIIVVSSSTEWLFILRLLGVRVEDIDVRWATIASATGLSDWQTAQVKIETGVPVDQALVEMGYEPEQVQKWLDQDAEANTLADRVSLLAEIGTAIQAMSAGIESGLVDQAQATAAIALVLGQVQSSGQGVDPA